MHNDLWEYTNLLFFVCVVPDCKTWPILYKDDKDREQALLTKQGQYISHLVGHEGPGSLLSYLKRKGWANSLSAEGESVRFQIFNYLFVDVRDTNDSHTFFVIPGSIRF